MQASASLSLPAHHTKIRKPEPERIAGVWQDQSPSGPKGELWLVGHRVLRDVPRVAALWSFLVDQMRRFMAVRKSPARTIQLSLVTARNGCRPLRPTTARAPADRCSPSLHPRRLRTR